MRAQTQLPYHQEVRSSSKIVHCNKIAGEEDSDYTFFFFNQNSGFALTMFWVISIEVLTIWPEDFSGGFRGTGSCLVNVHPFGRQL